MHIVKVALNDFDSCISKHDYTQSYSFGNIMPIIEFLNLIAYIKTKINPVEIVENFHNDPSY